jgi:prepilin-type N-terminal cleavage/methylation domain-containing protein
MHPVSQKGGFTLVEMLLAVSISVMVFAAMGMVLTKCFSLWKDSTAHWRLAQYARISRERILCGGFADPSGGLLSASNAVISLDSGWKYLQYITVAGSGNLQQIRGWDGTAEDKDIQLRDGASSWVYGQGSGAVAPTIKVDSFIAAVSNDLVTISYRMRFSAAGKSFTQPHTIQACLVNKE